MMDKIVAHNIKVVNMLKILQRFNEDSFIDITIVKGPDDSKDLVTISPSAFKPTDDSVPPIKEWFDINKLNDFII